MAHKCKSPGCMFYLPDTYPLPLCPWHAAPGRGPVKIAAALAIAAAGLGGGVAYHKFKEYMREKKLRRQREEWRRQYSTPIEEPAKKTAATRKKRSAKSSPQRKRKA